MIFPHVLLAIDFFPLDKVTLVFLDQHFKVFSLIQIEIIFASDRFS